MSNDELLAKWWKSLSEALGVESEADIQALLDLAGVAAHSIVRPAAPLTTFLVGYAAGVGSQSLAELIDQAEAAAEDFE